jgi:cation diffusion facilitator CzcD-associated flavoprotein CzcO
MFAVPQVNPHSGLEKPVWVKSGKSPEKMPIFLSAIYKLLETNIPRSLMRYSEMDFPDNVQLFPKHDDVQKYLEVYAQDVRDLVSFNTQVVDVRRSGTGDGNVDSNITAGWQVETLHFPSGKQTTKVYDAVVVGSGHYSVPFIPDIPGASEWNTKHPGSVSHSKYYRIPETYSDKKVIVVGNSASGLDISSQIATVCSAPLFLSSKSESYLAAGFKANPNIENVPEIIKFDANSKSITLKNGRVEHGVDAVLFCTGYLYSLPFLEALDPNPIGDGTRVEHTYQHLFYSPDPTLTFLTLPQKIIPFPLAEAQAAVLARVFSGRLSLPSEEEMRAWEAQTIAERGSGGEFHTLQFPRDVNYINFLYDWAASAERHQGLENNGRGKMTKRWGEWEFWARGRFPSVRKAFVEKGEERKNVRSLAEVGFDFDKWKAEQEEQGEVRVPRDHVLQDEKGSL